MRPDYGPSLDEVDERPSGLDGLQHDVTDAVQQEAVVDDAAVARTVTLLASLRPSHVTSSRRAPVRRLA